MSEPHLIMLTCEPHTSGTRAVLTSHITINLGHEITCNVRQIILWHHSWYYRKFCVCNKAHVTLNIRLRHLHTNITWAALHMWLLLANVWSYMTSSSQQSKQILSLSICSVMPPLPLRCPTLHLFTTRPAGPKITLPFPHLYICVSARPHLSRVQ